MKVKITDLLDQYEDTTVRLSPSGIADASDDMTKEVIPLQQKKHRFGWKEGLAAAAALAVIVTGGWLIKNSLRRDGGNLSGTEGTEQEHSMQSSDTLPGDTKT